MAARLGNAAQHDSDGRTRTRRLATSQSRSHDFYTRSKFASSVHQGRGMMRRPWLLLISETSHLPSVRYLFVPLTSIWAAPPFSSASYSVTRRLLEHKCSDAQSFSILCDIGGFPSSRLYTLYVPLRRRVFFIRFLDVVITRDAPLICNRPILFDWITRYTLYCNEIVYNEVCSH